MVPSTANKILGASIPSEKWRREKEPTIHANDRVRKLFEPYGCFPVRELHLLKNDDAFLEKMRKNLKRISTQAQGKSRELPSKEVAISSEIACDRNPGPRAHVCASISKKYFNGDSYTSFTHTIQFQGESSAVDFFAVLDGHAVEDIRGEKASEASRYCKTHLQDAITHAMQELNQQGEFHTFANALTVAFTLLDNKFKQEQPELATNAGTTLCLAALVKKKYLFVANCGDSRAVLGKGVGREFQELSYDYDVNREEAQKVALKRGGSLYKSQGEWGVRGAHGDLSMTRALGDFGCKSWQDIKPISSRPKIIVVKLDPQELDPETAVVILGSDGLFNAISSQDCTDYVSRLLSEQKDLEYIASSLVQHAKTRGSDDDITAFVIPLKQYLL